MTAAVRVGGFVLLLVVVGLLATGLGRAVGPIDAAASEKEMAAHPGGAGGMEMPADQGPQQASDTLPGGLMSSHNGYTLQPSASILEADPEAPVAFRVLGPDGSPVEAYTRSHEKPLHLIAVRRDLASYEHVHPVLGNDGVWRARLDLSQAGGYRLIADFVPTADGEPVTLGTDLSVAGEYAPRPLPAPSRTARVGDYTVTLDGRLVPGEESALTLSVSRDGRPVGDLQPYLGAYGHLVVLRDGDLAYLHVHPAGEPGDGTTRPGPGIRFFTTTPSPGSYRLFLDFRHEGVVRTAAFTVATDGRAAATRTGSGHGSDGHGH
ncbi:MAG: hypothetical protein ACRDO0_11295 [Nocardioidaceae bacterium]